MNSVQTFGCEDFKKLWDAIDYEVFEKLSKELLTAHTDKEWEQTQCSHDGKKDALFKEKNGNLHYMEAKFSAKCHQTNLVRISANILISLIDGAKSLWIITNSDISKDFSKFLIRFSTIPPLLNNDLRIFVVDGSLFALLFFEYRNNINIDGIDKLKSLNIDTDSKLLCGRSIENAVDIKCGFLNSDTSYDMDDTLRIPLEQSFYICVVVENRAALDVYFKLIECSNCLLTTDEEYLISKNSIRYIAFKSKITNHIDSVKLKYKVYSSRNSGEFYEKEINMPVEIVGNFETFFGGCQHLSICENSIIKIANSINTSKGYIFIFYGLAGVGKSKLIDHIISKCEYSYKKTFIYHQELQHGSDFKFFVTQFVKKIFGLDDDFYTLQDIKIDDIISIFPTDIYNLSEAQIKNIWKNLQNFTSLNIDEAAQFTASLTRKFLGNTNVFISIEDLHHADSEDFTFFRLFAEALANQCVYFFFSARTEEINDVFDSFKDMLYSNEKLLTYTHEIKELEDGDAYSFVKKALQQDADYDCFIQTVLKIAGRKPFNIVHTLIHFYSLGVMVPEKNGGFVIANDELLQQQSLDENIEKRFYNRFDSYDTKFTGFLEFLTEMTVMNKVPSSNFDAKMIKQLLFEKIIHKQDQVYRFDHENIYIFSKHYLLMQKDKKLSRVQNVAKKLLHYKELNIHEEYRCYQLLISENPKKFHEIASIYIDKLSKNHENWKTVLDEIGFILSNDNCLTTVERTELLLRKLEISAVTSDLDIVLGEVGKLLGDMKDKEFEHVEYLELYARAKIVEIDCYLQKGCYTIAKEKAYDFYKKIESSSISLSYQLKYAYSWVLNRYAIGCRGEKDYTKAIHYLKKSLQYAKQNGIDYVRHHSYYDLGGTYASLGNLNRAWRYQKLAYASLQYQEAHHSDAYIRTIIRSAIFYTIYPDIRSFDEAVRLLREAIDIGERKFFIWEKNRAYINLITTYIMQSNFESASTLLKKIIHSKTIKYSITMRLALLNHEICINLYDRNYEKLQEKAKESVEFLQKNSNIHKKASLLIRNLITLEENKLCEIDISKLPKISLDNYREFVKKDINGCQMYIFFMSIS